MKLIPSRLFFRNTRGFKHMILVSQIFYFLCCFLFLYLFSFSFNSTYFFHSSSTNWMAISTEKSFSTICLHSCKKEVSTIDIICKVPWKQRIMKKTVSCKSYDKKPGITKTKYHKRPAPCMRNLIVNRCAAIWYKSSRIRYDRLIARNC